MKTINFLLALMLCVAILFLVSCQQQTPSKIPNESGINQTPSNNPDESGINQGANISEYDEMISYEADLLRQMSVLIENPNKKSLPTSVNFDKAVKVLPINDFISIESIKMATSVNSYFYRIPLTIDTGYVYSTLVIKDGKVTGYDTAITADNSMGQVSYLFDESIVNDIIENWETEVSDIIILTVIPIKTDFIYFVANEKTFIIPFSSRPDWLGLDNGKVCEYDLFESCVNQLISEIPGYMPKYGDEGL